MGYLGRRIGLSQDQGDSNPGAAGGAVGGGLLDLFTHGYFERQGDIYNAPGEDPAQGLTATGGVISDYTDSGSGNVYRAHIFTSSGALNVTALGDFGNNVDYLCVAGGGGNQSSPAGSNRESGSGGGGLLSSHPDVPATFKQTQVTISSTGNINIVVGGGAGGKVQGSPSSIAFSSPVSTVGGGHGANQDGQVGGPGGSGGGNWYSSSTPGQATNYPGPTQQGYPGGIWGGTNNWTGGAGGGAGAQGANGGTSRSAGRTISITGSAAEYSRGGASNSYPSTPRNESGIFNTGDGASGVGNGGSGIVVVRYKIASIPILKATGGAISFYGGKTIHAFTSSGSFTTEPNWDAGSNEVEYVVVGGGGAGNGGPGPSAGGGGGAGGFITGTTTISHPSPTTVQVGGGAASATNTRTGGSNSFFGPPLAAYGGGGAGRHINGGANPAEDGQPGGSGGGACDGGGSAGSGNRAGAGSGSSAPISPQGNPGGAGAGNGGSNSVSGGGGGGAGQAGQAAVDQGRGGYGGYGKQLPTTFQNPVSATSLGVSPNPTKYNGPNSGNYWVAGGGGGAGSAPPHGLIEGSAGLGGGGQGYQNPNTGIPGSRDVLDAVVNTGGGGGGFHGPAGGIVAGSGGSGIVLIAYPS